MGMLPLLPVRSCRMPQEVWIRPLLRGRNDVDALKRQVYNQDKGSVGWKTSVSEGLVCLKPVLPIVGFLSPVFAQVQGEGR